MQTALNHSAERRLTTVAFADVADFSRLMAIDDVGTTRRWEQLRSDVLLPAIERHRGRLVDVIGDALLIEFGSVVAAVNWAIDAQQVTRSEALKINGDPLRLRISLNVEDVVPDGDNFQGDGVNIASRIHQAAHPGQIVATSVVRELVGNRASVRFRDLGTPRLKNIRRIVHVYAVEPVEPGVVPEAGLYQPYLEWAARPTVAVLPFRKSTGDEAETYFGTGITEDIITGLSRSRAFHVIARASTLKYADSTRDVRDVASELGVKYVMHGSVRRQGEKLRITAELVDASSNRSLWADRFDGNTADLFDFQDSIVARVVGSFEPRLRAAEVERVRNRPTDSLDAYDCVLQASSVLFDLTDASFAKAGQAVQRALELDPNYAQAHAFAALRLNFLIGEERSDDPERDKSLALEHARRAIALDPEDAFSQVVAAHLTSLVAGDPDAGLSMFDTALALDHNSALGWAWSGITLSYLGRGEDAMDRFRNAFKLSPFDSMNFSWWCGAGMAEFVNGNYAEAVKWLRKAQNANPRYAATLRMLAAALALEGQTSEARSAAAALQQLDAGFSVERFVSWYPMIRNEDKQALETGLIAAGLPR